MSPTPHPSRPPVTVLGLGSMAIQIHRKSQQNKKLHRQMREIKVNFREPLRPPAVREG